MFSSRTNIERARNRLSLAVERKLGAGALILDLTESNPTRVGLACPKEVLAPLSRPDACYYDPAPFGLLPARAAVSADCMRRGIEAPAERIVLTASTSESYALLFKLLCDPGDVVLVPRPSYPLFEYLAAFESVRTKPYPLSFDGEWRVDLSALREEADTHGRAVIVVHPNNPTGSFLSHDEARDISAFCAERGLALISDEVFADYAHAGDPRRAASLHETGEALTFVLGGLSKSCGLPQMKLGWIVAGGPPGLLQEAMERLEILSDTYLSVGAPVQVAAPSFLARLPELKAPIVRRVGANLRLLRERLATHALIGLLEPEGGWSAVLRVPATLPEEELAIRLVEKHDVLVHPGFFFDFPSEAYLILSLLPPEEVFSQGLARLLDAFTNVLT
ncbi:MAG: pyridoxal phosphate-dependent aminotransferase [Vicinamibacteria bacterium]|nr:pyridoxal phosphate-dependent aminotransferase [Vicinamibacteria bacterium]